MCVCVCVCVCVWGGWVYLEPSNSLSKILVGLGNKTKSVLSYCMKVSLLGCDNRKPSLSASASVCECECEHVSVHACE